MSRRRGRGREGETGRLIGWEEEESVVVLEFFLSVFLSWHLRQAPWRCSRLRFAFRNHFKADTRILSNEMRGNQRRARPGRVPNRGGLVQSRRFFFIARRRQSTMEKKSNFQSQWQPSRIGIQPICSTDRSSSTQKTVSGRQEREREMVQGRKERARRAFSLSTTSTVVRFRLPTLSLSLSRARALDSTRSLALSLSRSHPTSALERFHSHLHRETENKEEGGREKTRPRTETLNALEKRESERR